MELKLSQIAEVVEGELIGNGDIVITNVGAITTAGRSEITFVEDQQLLKQAEQTEASAVIVPPEVESSTKPIIKVPQPKLAFTKLMVAFNPSKTYAPGMHPSVAMGKNVSVSSEATLLENVVIGDRVKIEKGTVIGAGVCVGDDVVIGEGTLIYPGVTLYDRVVVGNRVIIHASTVIGSDGFGYVKVNDRQYKVPQVGNVIIEDDVEIGANVTIDRATIGSTVIKEGTKIDNLVQIAHNVTVGKHSIACAQAGIAGSVTIGDNVIVAAQAGIADHVTIGENVVIGAQAGVPPKKNIRPNQFVFGAPARPEKQTKRQMAAQARLPHLMGDYAKLKKEVQEMRKKIETLETTS